MKKGDILSVDTLINGDETISVLFLSTMPVAARRHG